MQFRCNNVNKLLHFFRRETRDPIATLASVTEKRWIRIQEKLNLLQKRVNVVTQKCGLTVPSMPKPKTNKFQFQDIVIEMDPNHASKGIVYLAQKLTEKTSVFFACHTHSSLKSKHPMDFWPESDPYKSRLQHNVALTLIWKPVGLDPILKSGGKQPILGEVNIYRFFSRMFGLFEYESNSAVHWIDSQLDGLHCILHGAATAKSLACKRPPMLNNVITVADVAYASLCFRVKEIKSLTSNFVQVPDLK